MKKLKKWTIVLLTLLLIYFIGVQAYQYYLIKGNVQIFLKNNMWAPEETASYQIYLDGELIRDAQRGPDFFADSDGLEFYLKPGKHTLVVEWIEKGIKEEIHFYTFLLVKYIWIWFDNHQLINHDIIEKDRLHLFIEYNFIDPYNRFA